MIRTEVLPCSPPGTECLVCRIMLEYWSGYRNEFLIGWRRGGVVGRGMCRSALGRGPCVHKGGEDCQELLTVLFPSNPVFLTPPRVVL